MGLQRCNGVFRSKITLIMVMSAMVFVWICTPATIAAEETEKSVFRNSVYKLKHIPAEDAKKILLSLKIGTHINQIGDMNALIVTTGNPIDLQKAAAILGMIDSEQEFIIATIKPAADPQKLPKNEDIAAELGDIVIGTFQDPPSGTEKPLAIIDFHNSNLIAIGLDSSVNKIAEVVKKLTLSAEPETRKKPKTAVQQPDQQAEQEEQEEAVTDPQQTGADKTANGHDLQRQRRQVQLDEQKNDQQPDDSEPFSDELLETLEQTEKELETKKEKIPDDIFEAMQRLQANEEKEDKDKDKDKDDEDDEVRSPAVAEVTSVQKVEKTPAPIAKTSSGVSNDELIEAIRALTAQMAKQPSQSTAPAALEPAGQTVQSPQEIDNIEMEGGQEELELSITLPEKVQIVALLELVGKQLGLNYIYDPAQVKGEFMLKVHDGKIKVRETYDLLESVLKTKKLVMTRRGKLVTIVPMAQALEYDPIIRKSSDHIQPGDVIVTTVLKLKHTDTATAQKMLESMKVGMGFNAIPETDTLIITDYAYRMDRIEKLIAMIDVPGKPRKFRFRQLKYTEAVDIAPKVKALAEQLGSVTISIVAKQAKPATPAKAVRGKKPTPAKPAAAAPAVNKGVYLDTDERTNRIFMIGEADELETVDAMIDALDVPKTDLRFTRMYEVQNIGPDEAYEYLSQLGVAGQSNKTTSSSRRTSSRTTTTSKTKTPATKPASQSGSESTEELPQVVVVDAINSLLINATAQQHVEITEILAYVDARPDETATPYVVYRLENQEPEELADILDQLLNKTKKSSKSSKGTKESKVQSVARPRDDDEEVIEIVPDVSTRSLIVFASRKNQQLISSLIEQLDISRPQVLLDVTLVEITKDNEFNFDLDVVSKYPAMVAEGAMQYGGITALMPVFPRGQRVLEGSSTEGTGKAFYADRHIQALLDIMDDKQYGRVLARPSLLVWDNEEGVIKSDKVIYVGKEKSQNITGEGGNLSTTSDITFDSYDSGITLTITPHITSETLLQLDIELDRKDFVAGATEVDIGDKTVPKPLDTVSSNVSTKAVIPNGATIILGGIETVNQSKGVTKVPLLGDIPIVGALFRGNNETDNQSKLYVFVKAHIIQPGDELTGNSDIEKISAKKRRSFEDAEIMFQGLQGTPGIKAKPLDPIKILEDDEYIEDIKAQRLQRQAEEASLVSDES